MNCPTCQHPGKKIERLTVAALLKPSYRLRLTPSAQYFLCLKTDCPMVYFADHGVQFSKDQVTVRVGFKEMVHPIPLCYCFGWTQAELASELVQNQGGSPTAERIKKELKLGNCYCQITNPEGTCCLGNITKVTQQIKEELRKKKILR